MLSPSNPKQISRALACLAHRGLQSRIQARCDVGSVMEHEMNFSDYCRQIRPRSLDTQTRGLRTVSVRDLDALRPHLDAWDRLAWDAPQRLATMLPAWADAGFRYGPGPKEQWLCSFAYDGDRLVGVLRVIIGGHPVLGNGWPILRTCDRHVAAENIVLAPDRAADALPALLAEVGREVPNHLGLDLIAVRKNSPVWIGLQGGIDGYLTCTGSRYMNSLLDVRGDFDSYLATLGQMRKNLRRYWRSDAIGGSLRAMGKSPSKSKEGKLRVRNSWITSLRSRLQAGRAVVALPS
jgi:hypothetical protein